MLPWMKQKHKEVDVFWRMEWWIHLWLCEDCDEAILGKDDELLEIEVLHKTYCFKNEIKKKKKRGLNVENFIVIVLLIIYQSKLAGISISNVPASWTCQKSSVFVALDNGIEKWFNTIWMWRIPRLKNDKNWWEKIDEKKCFFGKVWITCNCVTNWYIH